MARRCWGFNRNLQRCRRTGSWVLYCVDHRRQWIKILFSAVFVVGVAFVTYWGVFRWQPGDEEALRAESLNTLRILTEKLRVADQIYEWMVQREQLFEKAHPTAIPPSPYRDVGERLSRDLPKFKAAYSATLIAERWGRKRPFDLYVRAYQAFEDAETYEQRTLRFLYTSWQRWEDIGVIPFGKMRVYGIVLTNLLKQYLLCYTEVSMHLKEAGATRLPELPKKLFFVEEIEREKKAGTEKQQ